MSRRRCPACGQSFVPHPCVPCQKYCSSLKCQKARRRDYQAQKMRNDPAYRENQQRAQENWRKEHPGYWQGYRKDHPEYVQLNREKQRERNSRRRAKSQAEVAKMDEFPSQIQIIPGTYKLTPLGGDGIAKMTEQIVRIHAIQDGYDAVRPPVEDAPP